MIKKTEVAKVKTLFGFLFKVIFLHTGLYTVCFSMENPA